MLDLDLPIVSSIKIPLAHGGSEGQASATLGSILREAAPCGETLVACRPDYGGL